MDFYQLQQIVISVKYLSIIENINQFGLKLQFNYLILETVRTFLIRTLLSIRNILTIILKNKFFLIA